MDQDAAARARKRHQLLTWRRGQLVKYARLHAARGDLRLIQSPADLDAVLDDDDDGVIEPELDLPGDG